MRPGVWKLSVAAGRDADRRPRREYRTVRADSARDASHQLAAFVTEVAALGARAEREARQLSFDDAIGRFLVGHLAGEKGREEKTVRDYRMVHDKWLSPTLGRRPVRRIDEADLDRAFGKMRAAGLSRSRMNQARSLYAPFFRWAKRRGIVTRNPMAEFELPTSGHVTRARVPPEVEELSLLLRTRTRR